MYLTSSFGLLEESLGMEHASWFPLDMPSLSPVFFPSDPAYGSTYRSDNGFREATAGQTTSLVLCAFHHTLGVWNERWELGCLCPVLAWLVSTPPPTVKRREAAATVLLSNSLAPGMGK